MALLGLPRWRTVSKRATRDLGKDAASKSQPAHSDLLAEQTQTQDCSRTALCSVTKVHPVPTSSMLITVIVTPSAKKSPRNFTTITGAEAQLLYLRWDLNIHSTVRILSQTNKGEAMRESTPD